MATLNILMTSRYKDTPVYQDADGVRFALWEPPAEFSSQVIGSVTHAVSSHEIGFLDILAVKYYGDGSEVLGWLIAEYNAIIDPETDMYPGQRLRIPPISVAQQFRARYGNVSVQ